MGRIKINSYLLIISTNRKCRQNCNLFKNSNKDFYLFLGSRYYRGN